MFTDAIHCDPKDHRYLSCLTMRQCSPSFISENNLCFWGRFFGNRSSCYECLGNYTLALADAEESIRLAPYWPYGYFRKGRALMGMKVCT